MGSENKENYPCVYMQKNGEQNETGVCGERVVYLPGSLRNRTFWVMNKWRVKMIWKYLITFWEKGKKADWIT